MSTRKSLGANPLDTKGSDPVLREVLRGGARSSPEERLGRTALVFSGRGAEAAFEVGVLAGLVSSGTFDAHVVTGVSVGAFNGAVVAGHGGTMAEASARLMALWLDRVAGSEWTGRNGFYRARGDLRSFLHPARLPGALIDLLGDGAHWMRDAFSHGARMVRSDDDLTLRVLWLLDVGSMLSLEPFAALVRDVVNLGAVRGSGRLLRIATADWATGRVEIRDGSALEDETGHDRIVAAAARPGIFPCVEIDGRPHVDAAPFSASELGPALDADATDLHVPVFLSTRDHDDRPASTVDALDRVLAELQIARLERELAELPRAHAARPVTVHLYRGRLGPAKSHGFLDVGRDRVKSLVEHGRQVVARHDCRESGCLRATTAPAR